MILAFKHTLDATFLQVAVLKRPKLGATWKQQNSTENKFDLLDILLKRVIIDSERFLLSYTLLQTYPIFFSIYR